MSSSGLGVGLRRRLSTRADGVRLTISWVLIMSEVLFRIVFITRARSRSYWLWKGNFTNRLVQLIYNLRNRALLLRDARTVPVHGGLVGEIVEDDGAPAAVPPARGRRQRHEGQHIAQVHCGFRERRQRTWTAPPIFQGSKGGRYAIFQEGSFPFPVWYFSTLATG